jgi:hypothetical protein
VSARATSLSNCFYSSVLSTFAQRLDRIRFS